MENDILFDNIYIGHSVDDAEKLASETWALKKPVEAAQDSAAGAKDAQDEGATVSLKENPVEFVNQKIQQFTAILAQGGPIPAVKAVPEVAGAGAALVVAFILLFVSVLPGGSAPAPEKKGKAPAKSGKEKSSEAKGTGVETSKGGATKRNTRSSGAE